MFTKPYCLRKDKKKKVQDEISGKKMKHFFSRLEKERELSLPSI